MSFKPKKSFWISVASFLSGVLIGSLASAITFGGSPESFVSGLLLFPIAMTIGSGNAAIHGPAYLGPIIVLGVLATSVAFAKTLRSPSKTWVAILFGGTSLWAFGNEFGMQVIMSI